MQKGKESAIEFFYHNVESAIKIRTIRDNKSRTVLRTLLKIFLRLKRSRTNFSKFEIKVDVNRTTVCRRKKETVSSTHGKNLPSFIGSPGSS